MKYAMFSEKGEFLHLLVEGLHDIPAAAIEISENLAETIMNEQDGMWRLMDGEIIKTPLPDPASPTLDDLKAAKRIEINNVCLAAIDGGFEHDGHIYDSDERSKSNIIGTATGVTAGIPLPDGFTWRTHDNEDIPMDGPGVIALGASLLQHISAQYARSWQLKAQIDAAESPPDLDLIVWETPQAA